LSKYRRQGIKVKSNDKLAFTAKAYADVIKQAAQKALK
jgi:hypothetical protein